MLLEEGFVVLVLQLSAGAVIEVLAKASGAEVDILSGNVQLQLMWAVIYVITFLLILRQWKQAIHVATRDKFLILLVGFALASIFWTTDPQITLRRSVALVGTTLFGLYLATRYSLRELLRLLALSLSIGALLSVVFALALPTYGIEAYNLGISSWRGIYRHKNLLGRLMGLNAITLLLLAPGNYRNRWILRAGVGLSVSLLLLSSSKGALVVFLVLLILWPVYRLLQWNDTLAVPVLIIVILVGGSLTTLLVDNLEFLLNSIGKDVTLTGRIPLWAAVIDKIGEQPLLGYGFNGFWLGWEGESADIWQQFTWTPPHAHNGFLDLALDLGVLGLSIFVVGFLMSFIRASRWVRSTKAAEPIWLLEYLAFIFIANQSETTILLENDIFWVLYVATVFSIPVLRSPRVDLVKTSKQKVVTQESLHSLP